MIKMRDFETRIGYKPIIMVFTIIVSLSLSYYYSFFRYESIVYTHSFYVPIILAGIWYQKKALYLAIAFGMIHILITYISPINLSIYEFERSLVFLTVAYITCNLSTKQAKREEELTRTRNDLEMRIREMERFAYAISHDLMTPLVTIGGFAGFLRKDIENGDIARIETDLGTIEDVVIKMEKQLDDTLELSRIGRVTKPSENVPMSEIVQEALSQTEEEIGSRGVEVSVADNLPNVYVDRLRIVEALVNLIENSIKYMGDEDFPKIEVGQRTDDGNEVFFVRDNGIGIESGLHERVFDLFYKVDLGSKGSGVGLAIVKKIIEVHDGRIWIESEKDDGCTFCFTLPRAAI